MLKSIIASLLLLLATALPAAAANLVVNGDFESPLQGPPTWAQTFSSFDPPESRLPGWTLAPPIDAEHSWLYAIYRTEAVVTMTAIEGQSLLFAGGGWIEQTFATKPGAVYSVSYDLAATRYQSALLDVTITGAAGDVLCYSPGAVQNWGTMPVLTYAHTWQAVGESATIRLAPAAGYLHNWPIVDNVQVAFVHAPEPASATVLAGLGLLAFTAWRRRSRPA
jgi:hypothetical protein